MTLDDMLMGAKSMGALQNFALQNSLSNDQLMSAIQALTPAIASGVRARTASPEGFASLMNMMNTGRHELFLDDGDLLGSASSQTVGNEILGQIFGSKDVSRGVAQYAAQTSGISSTILKSLLPIIASMVMGGLTRQSRGSGMGDLLGQILGGGGMPGGGTSPSGGLGDILGDMLGGGMAGGGSRSGGAPSLDDLLGGILGGGPPQSGVDPHSTDGGIFGDLLNPGSAGSAMDDLLKDLSNRSR